MCDLLWSDPDDAPGWALSPRGAGWLFGPDVARAFNHRNNISFIARAHQLVLEGYREMFDGGVVTVWSAPNYCYRCGNVASILEVSETGGRNYKIFDAANQEMYTAVVKIVLMIGEDYLRRDLWQSIFCDIYGLWTNAREKIDVLLDFKIPDI
jgi:hypothetical protein